jgi:PBP1b-binding outer membrane lipoprotein LpoB
MRALLVLLFALLLAGCSKEPPQVVLVTAEPATPAIAPECTDVDKSWAELPDDDISRKTGARNYDQNRSNYRVLLHKRRICRASLQAQYPEKPLAKKE